MCPPLYGYVPPTKHIWLMNQPYGFTQGGFVHAGQAMIPKESLPYGDVDTVPARLEPGELVIPRKHVPLVRGFLQSHKIKLPNM